MAYERRSIKMSLLGTYSPVELMELFITTGQFHQLLHLRTERNSQQGNSARYMIKESCLKQ